MKAVCLLALLLVASCAAIRVTPAAQSAHPDWITPEEKMPSLPSNSAEESAVETVSSMLETQANIKAQAATEAKAGEGGDSPSWILPLAPAGYGGPGVINPYSNVNPLNPMAAQMQAEAAGQFKAGTPQTQMGPANNNNAPVQAAFLELESNTQGKKAEILSVRPVIEEARIRLPFGNDAAFAMPPFFPFAPQAMERGLPTSLRLPFPIPGLPGGQLPIPAGVHGPIVEKIDISYSVPRAGADGFAWPVVNNEVQEHIEIVKTADEERQDDQEDDSDLMKNIAKNPNAFMTGLIRELVSGHDNAVVPAKLEVVEIPAEFNPLGEVTSGAPHFIGGLVIEPEFKDEQAQEEASSEQTSESSASASEASSEAAAAAAASSQSIDVMDATPIEELPTETSSASTTESTAAPTSEPVLPAPIESEASALLNALVQQKAQEMADELEKELVSENSESSASATKSKL